MGIQPLQPEVPVRHIPYIILIIGCHNRGPATTEWKVVDENTDPYFMTDEHGLPMDSLAHDLAMLYDTCYETGSFVSFEGGRVLGKSISGYGIKDQGVVTPVILVEARLNGERRYMGFKTMDCGNRGELPYGYGWGCLNPLTACDLGPVKDPASVIPTETTIEQEPVVSVSAQPEGEDPSPDQGECSEYNLDLSSKEFDTQAYKKADRDSFVYEIGLDDGKQHYVSCVAMLQLDSDPNRGTIPSASSVVVPAYAGYNDRFEIDTGRCCDLGVVPQGPSFEEWCKQQGFRDCGW